ncbi:hypothetical protein N7457_001273 [Penicillium paradoxum]|uniref:uncharacterized protein n=1 Tax=Penicillium paradoxum TaxID=176176 RepID=UPI002546FCAB|nr:uncharacterized protein N7457_001273 [Penicillium paradoxum]KAJ5794674.1 hypothetical protein N7457_001273 [Penicillium paradoxum]
MSASPEASESARQARATDSPPPASPRLETEAKHDNDDDSQKDQAEKKQDQHESEELKEVASTPKADEIEEGELTAPPLPDEIPPPLPAEAPPQPDDDGWEPVWEPSAQAYYFYNRFTAISQWENPRVPQVPVAPGTEDNHEQALPQKEPVLGGYNPAIHGDYDPTADYAKYYEAQEEPTAVAGMDPSAAYAATGTFNRFTGRWQAASINPENHNDENKSRRQMGAFFDVDAAANSHDGRSLRAERSARKLTSGEVKKFKAKRREKKEEKRRAWLRD